MAKVTSMSQAEYSEHRGVSRAAVSHAVKQERITLLADGRIDPTVADIQWSKNTRARAPSSSKAGGASASGGAGVAGVTPTTPASGSGIADAEDSGDDYWRSRARREAAEASIAEHKQAELQGNLIQVQAVEAVWSNALASVREHLLQVRSRVAPLLAVETDPFKIDQMLDLEHNQALRLMAGAQTPGAAKV